MESIPSTSCSSKNEIEGAALCEIVPSVATPRPSIDRSYDVFINHCGDDVKKTLASHIFNALESSGLRVFLDKDGMETGESIPAQLEDAIRNSSVQIAIFSQNYAGSRWCLDELCLMMQHPDKILPVFYDVEPCDLRWMDKDGPYAKAFRTHQDQQRYDSQLLEKWKKTLFRAAGRSGCELKKGFKGDEGALVKHILNNVLKRVKREPLYVAKHPVGLDEVAEEFETTMLLRANENGEENVKVVGIVGMGGAGKTTLALHLFNIKRSNYGRSSFLFDVRSKDLTDLQSKLLQDLTGVGQKIHSTREGIGLLRSRLSYCQALVILDDVDSVEQLEALLVVKDVLRSSSLILMTSRDKGLLKYSQMSLYDMRRLSKRHARQLFCWHAFLRPSPMEGFEELVERFLIASGGLPLALKVFGALVYGKNTTYSSRQLEKISRRPEQDIKRRLRVSYDALDEDDQEMFLDVACFFISEEKGKVIRIWDGCGWSGLVGLQTLENKCLIEFDDEDCIRMHDQLRDMGREIGDEESNRPRRLWRPEDVSDLERRSRTTQVIRGIRSTAAPLYDAGRLRYPNYTIRETPRFTWLDGCKEVLGICVEFFRRLKFETCGLLAGEGGLKLLVVEGDRFKGICGNASTDLVWLRWYNCPYRSLPFCLHSIEKLRVLELFDGAIRTLWHGSKGLPTQLRELTIASSCLAKFPKSIGQLRFLEKIVSCAGKEMADNMKTLPDEFCRLQSLKHLELINCRVLELLPQNFGDLTNLQHLNLRGGKNLQALPDSFSRLLQLKDLCLRYCRTLRFRQDTLRNMSALEHVDFSGCENLQVLPIQITRQASLQTLYLASTGLKELPNEIGDLRNLEKLELGSDCLSSLPTSIWNLSRLTSLELWRCKNLKRLPQDDADDPTSSGVRYLRGGFEHMRNLKNLYVLNCPLCEVIPFTSVSRKVEEDETTFPTLEILTLAGTKISRISISESVCPSLSSLRLHGNTHLVEVEALPKALKYLSLGRCRALKRITGLSKLAMLFRLDMSGCRELEELPNLAELTSLEILDADGCWKLKSIKGLERLKELCISAGDGAIWNDIQLLQRLPCSKSSERSLTTRAAPGTENRVETILSSLASQLSILELCTAEEPSGSSYGAFQLSNIKSVIAAMVCILFKASARDASLRIRYPYRLGAGYLSHKYYEVFGQEGECINMRMFTNDLGFITGLKAHNAQQISVELGTPDHPPSVMEVRKGWIVMARNAEEQGKILQIWNTLITRLHSDCLLNQDVPGAIASHNRR